MSDSEDLAQLRDELDAVNKAITRILKIGNQHANNSGGSSRATTETDLPALRKHRAIIKQQILALEDPDHFGKGMRFVGGS